MLSVCPQLAHNPRSNFDGLLQRGCGRIQPGILGADVPAYCEFLNDDDVCEDVYPVTGIDTLTRRRKCVWAAESPRLGVKPA